LTDGPWCADSTSAGRFDADLLRVRRIRLDLAVEARNEGGLRALLLSLGYADKPRDDTSAWNYVLADAAGHEVDVHVITFDERGNGIYGPPENGEMYSRFRATRGLRGKAPLGGIDEPQR
jgi:hypothetical protein